MIKIKCFYCNRDACAKLGGAKGNIIKALFGMKAWVKSEQYVCRKHYYSVRGLDDLNEIE